MYIWTHYERISQTFKYKITLDRLTCHHNQSISQSFNITPIEKKENEKKKQNKKEKEKRKKKQWWSLFFS